MLDLSVKKSQYQRNMLSLSVSTLTAAVWISEFLGQLDNNKLQQLSNLEVINPSATFSAPL